jgi:hypothetical protein
MQLETEGVLISKTTSSRDRSLIMTDKDRLFGSHLLASGFALTRLLARARASRHRTRLIGEIGN